MKTSKNSDLVLVRKEGDNLMHRKKKTLNRYFYTYYLCSHLSKTVLLENTKCPSTQALRKNWVINSSLSQVNFIVMMIIIIFFWNWCKYKINKKQLQPIIHHSVITTILLKLQVSPFWNIIQTHQTYFVA